MFCYWQFHTMEISKFTIGFLKLEIFKKHKVNLQVSPKYWLPKFLRKCQSVEMRESKLHNFMNFIVD
jgi:hypothetical protein